MVGTVHTCKNSWFCMRLRALKTSMPKLRANTKLSRIRSVIVTWRAGEHAEKREKTKNERKQRAEQIREGGVRGQRQTNILTFASRRAGHYTLAARGANVDWVFVLRHNSKKKTNTSTYSSRSSHSNHAYTTTMPCPHENPALIRATDQVHDFMCAHAPRPRYQFTSKVSVAPAYQTPNTDTSIWCGPRWCTIVQATHEDTVMAFNPGINQTAAEASFVPLSFLSPW